MPYRAPTMTTGRVRRKPADTRECAAKRGYDHTWRKLRESLITSDPMHWLTCTMCGVTPATPSGIQLDHIAPLGEGGARLDPDNLRPLCVSCHARRHASDDAKKGYGTPIYEKKSQ